MDIKSVEENEILNVPFEVKESDIAETGSFKGYGSIFGNKDSHSDIILPGAFSKTIANGGRNGTGVAMLFQHDVRRPIGIWKQLVEDNKGLKVEGQLAMGTQDGKETYELMKMGALKGLSIGYDSVIHEIDEKKKIRYLKEVELWEISPVVFAANKRAVVLSVKAIEEAKTEREFEDLLREAGISNSVSKYLVKVWKNSSLREAGKGSQVGAGVLALFASLTQANEEIEISCKSVVPFKSHPLADEDVPWDAETQIKDASVADLKLMCAWHDKNNADKKSAYKLPHHKQEGYTTVWKGCAVAMARLLQANTFIPEEDRKGCYNHLAKHYKEFKKPVPDFKDYNDREWLNLFSDCAMEVGFCGILESLTELNS